MMLVYLSMLYLSCLFVMQHAAKLIHMLYYVAHYLNICKYYNYFAMSDFSIRRL